MWDIVDYSDSYFDGMIEMTKEYYGNENDISNSEFIIHEYFANPAGKAYIKLAYDSENDTVAGQYIVIPCDYYVSGHFYKSVLSLNTLTSEMYRGQKVFSKLAAAVYEKCEKEGVSFCYGAPNPNSYPGFIKKLSFNDIGEIPLLLRVRNPIWILLDKLNISYKYCDTYSIDNKIQKDIELIKIEKKNIDLLNDFWERIKHKYSVIGNRNVAFLKWRYIDIPRRDYHIYAAVKNGRVQGYIVGRIAEVSDMRCGMIVDFLFDNGCVDAGKALINILAKYFKKSRVGLIGCLMKANAEEYKLLKKKGFFVCPRKLLPQPFRVILRPFVNIPEDKKQSLNNFENWFFTMGDYDVI